MKFLFNGEKNTKTSRPKGFTTYQEKLTLRSCHLKTFWSYFYIARKKKEFYNHSDKFRFSINSRNGSLDYSYQFQLLK